MIIFNGNGRLRARQGVPDVSLPPRSNTHQEDGYYHEYCRLYLANIALTSQVKELMDEKHQLISRLSKYEVPLPTQDEEMATPSERAEKTKRMRRNADEIERYYKCSVKVCGKSYGSEGSLNQHYKLKHPEIYLQLPNVQCNLGPEEDSHSQVRDKENRGRAANRKHK